MYNYWTIIHTYRTSAETKGKDDMKAFKLTENAEKFLSRNPSFLGRFKGYSFYECPIHGEDANIKAITIDGKLATTNCWDYDVAELTYWIANR
jgi:hypothetical protein